MAEPLSTGDLLIEEVKSFARGRLAKTEKVPGVDYQWEDAPKGRKGFTVKLDVGNLSEQLGAVALCLVQSNLVPGMVSAMIQFWRKGSTSPNPDRYLRPEIVQSAEEGRRLFRNFLALQKKDLESHPDALAGKVLRTWTPTQ